MRPRYLTPFIVFLTLFLISASACYFFYNRRMSVRHRIAELEVMRKKIVFKASAEQVKALQNIEERAGYKPRALESTTMNEEKGFLKNLRAFSLWIRDEAEAIRQIDNAKSQQSTQFAHFAGLDPKAQLDQATTVLGELPAAIAAAIVEANSFLSTSDKDYLNAAEKDRRRQIRDKISDLESRLRARVTKLTGQITAAKQVIGAKPGNEIAASEREQVRTTLRDAGQEVLALLREMTYVNDVNGKREAIPRLVDSDAKQKAMHLALLVFTNDAYYLRRTFEGEVAAEPTADQISQLRPADPNQAMPVAYRALIADYYRKKDRVFTLDPYYLAGVSLENVIDAQELLLQNLVAANHILSEKLLLSMQRVGEDGAQIKSGGQTERDFKARAAEAITDSSTRLRTRSNTLTDDNDGVLWRLRRADDKDTNRDESLLRAMQGIRLAEETHWEEELQKVTETIDRHKRQRQAAIVSFVKFKKASHPDMRPIAYKGSDGNIKWVDRENSLFHISLGRADNINLGMRFVVYKEAGGARVDKALIEVLRIPRENYAVCGLVAGDAATINEGDDLDHPLYHQGRFLSVALVGDYKPEVTQWTRQQFTQRLREMHVPVNDLPSVNTQITILDVKPSQINWRSGPGAKIFLQLLERANAPWMLANSLRPFFVDQ